MIRISKFVDKILNNKNPKTTKLFTLKEVSDYLRENKFGYLSFWLVMDYMQENNLFK